MKWSYFHILSPLLYKLIFHVRVFEFSKVIKHDRHCCILLYYYFYKVSYGATDSIFNTMRERYSHLVRTIPSMDAENRALICLMKTFEWEKLVIATSSTSLPHLRVGKVQ